jgi:hypothetical protein
MQHISQSDYLDESIAETLLPEVSLGVWFPQSGDSAAPVIDIEQNDVLVLFNADWDIVDRHREEA